MGAPGERSRSDNGANPRALAHKLLFSLLRGVQAYFPDLSKGTNVIARRIAFGALHRIARFAPAPHGMRRRSVRGSNPLGASTRRGAHRLRVPGPARKAWRHYRRGHRESPAPRSCRKIEDNTRPRLSRRHLATPRPQFPRDDWTSARGRTGDRRADSNSGSGAARSAPPDSATRGAAPRGDIRSDSNGAARPTASRPEE